MRQARTVRSILHWYMVTEQYLKGTLPMLGRTTWGPQWERNETERKVAKVLEQVAAQVGASNIQAGASHHYLSRLTEADGGFSQSRSRT